jgi:predicted ATPase
VAAPLLAADGGNLAAVFATLRHIREDSTELDAAIEAAFPGARLDVPIPEQHASFTLTFPDLPRRGFAAHELSDGTLHFLALLGALLSYRLPPLIVLNEPEASLHPDLLPAIAGVIATAARRTQILVVTHSNALAAALEAETGAPAREVLRQDGATRIAGLTRLGQFEDE